MAEWVRRLPRLEFVRHVHSRYGDRVDVTEAELVLGELIGNVVRYAPGQARVRADFDKRGITIAVADRGPGFCAPLVTGEPNLLSESGRGLAIIATLAERLDVECEAPTCCCVRARLGARQPNATPARQ